MKEEFISIVYLHKSNLCKYKMRLSNRHSHPLQFNYQKLIISQIPHIRITFNNRILLRFPSFSNWI